MADAPRPAWSRGESVLGAFEVPGTLGDMSPQWAWGDSDGTGATVAIVDSGVDADHPDLEGCVDTDAGLELYVAPDGTLEERRGAHRDSFGHGTAVAGIVHAVAPGARIVSVKVLSGSSGNPALFLRGLAWAIEQRFEVANLSLGTSDRDWALPFYELCDQAYFERSFLVTAANNIPQPSFPNLFASVASVACGPAKGLDEFHFNDRPPTEFLARGIDIDVAWRRGRRRQVTGNSYAAPHIAGMAARIMAKHPDLRPFQVKALLWATAANVAFPGGAPSAPAPRRRLASSRAQSAVHSVPTLPS